MTDAYEIDPAYDENGRPILRVLRYLPIAGFTATHFQQLQRLAPMMWDGQTPFTMAKEVYDGLLHVWEVEGTDHAVVLTRIVGEGDRILWLDGIAGDGIMARAEAIVADLRTIGREYGCTQVRASSIRGAFEVLFERFGFQPLAVTYTMDIDQEEPQDGRIEADADLTADAEG